MARQTPRNTSVPGARGRRRRHTGRSRGAGRRRRRTRTRGHRSPSWRGRCRGRASPLGEGGDELLGREPAVVIEGDAGVVPQIARGILQARREIVIGAEGEHPGTSRAVRGRELLSAMASMGEVVAGVHDEVRAKSASRRTHSTCGAAMAPGACRSSARPGQRARQGRIGRLNRRTTKALALDEGGVAETGDTESTHGRHGAGRGCIAQRPRRIEELGCGGLTTGPYERDEGESPVRPHRGRSGRVSGARRHLRMALTAITTEETAGAPRVEQRRRAQRCWHGRQKAAGGGRGIPPRPTAGSRADRGGGTRRPETISRRGSTTPRSRRSSMRSSRRQARAEWRRWAPS